MSGRVTAVFGGIVLMALAGLDYGAAANSRPEGRPLGVAAHVMDRFAQAKAALGFPAPAAPVSSAGRAMAAIQAALDLTAEQGYPADAAMPDLAAAVGMGDQKAIAAMVEAEFAKVAAGIEGAAPEVAPKPGRARAGKITVGIGTCAKRGAGTFCSVGGG